MDNKECFSKQREFNSLLWKVILDSPEKWLSVTDKNHSKEV